MNPFRRFIACLLIFGVTTLLPAHAQKRVAPPAASDTGTIVVFRASSVVGRLFKPPVLDNSKELAIVRDGRIVTLPLTPGEHVISASVAGKETKLDVKPGETYYLRMTLVTAGQFSMFKGQLTLVNEEQAKNEMAKLKPADAADLKSK